MGKKKVAKQTNEAVLKESENVSSTVATKASQGVSAKRVDTGKVNKKTIESLIRVGAMDAFGTRGQLMVAMVPLMEIAQHDKKAQSQGQVGLFDLDNDSPDAHKDQLPDVPDIPHHELLLFEKELLGFYFSSHPLSRVMAKLEQLGAVPIATLTDEMIGQRFSVCGTVATLKKIFTKANNQEMAFVKLEDTGGSIECVVFPKMYAKNPSLWQQDAIMLLSGKLDQKDERLSFLVDDAKKIEVKGS